MSIGKVFGRPNILIFLATFTDSFVVQQIVKAAVFLRLNYRVALPVSHYLTLFILQLSRLQTAGTQSLITMQLTLELPARSPTLPNPSLNDPEALEQTSVLQALMTVLPVLKDLSSCRGYTLLKPRQSQHPSLLQCI
jgi:hypothetical protein